MFFVCTLNIRKWLTISKPKDFFCLNFLLGSLVCLSLIVSTLNIQNRLTISKPINIH